MNNKIIIAIDAMGGENAPCKNIEGVFLFLKKNKKKGDVFFRSIFPAHCINCNQYFVIHDLIIVKDYTSKIFLPL